MKKTLLILAFALVQQTTFAQQAPALQWQKCYGGTNGDIAWSIQPTTDGGYIMAGDTSSIDEDVTGNHGGRDIWVVKINSTGTLQWKKALGGTSDDYSQSIRPTPDGGYILAGATSSTDGDVTGNHGGYNDAWVVKLSSTGSVQWQKTLGGTNDEYANSIQPTPDGGYILASTTFSTDGDVIGNHGIDDAWIVKLDATGAIVWQKALGGTAWEDVSSIQSTTDGGYVMAGYTRSNDGDVTGNHGTDDAWVVKLSSTGSVQWQKCLGGTGNEGAYSIQPTADGGYIVAGATSSINGDVTGIHGGADVWVVKLSSVGNLQWQKALGGTGEDYANGIQPTADGGYIVAGQTNSTDGDVTGNHGGNDVWVVKLGPELSTTGFEKSTVVVYPNPTSTLLTVQNNNNTVIDSITITDLMGKVVLTQTTNTNQVNVAPLASGTYFLEATSGKDQFTTKFVKEY